MEILFALRLFAINLLTGNRRRSIFCILFGARTLALSLKSQYTTQYTTAVY